MLSVNGHATRVVEVSRPVGSRMKAAPECTVRSKVVATVAACAMAIALGVLDYVTGREWAISAFHLLPTCLAAWVAGRPAGFAVGALRTVAWFVKRHAKRSSLYPPRYPCLERAHAVCLLFCCRLAATLGGGPKSGPERRGRDASRVEFERQRNAK